MTAEARLRSEFQRLFQAQGVWSCLYEPGRGSAVGYPDLQLLIGGVLCPVEIKTCVVKNGAVYPSQIRPSQIYWHHDLLSAGGKSWIVLCRKVAGHGLDACALPSVDREYTSRWKQGFPLFEMLPWIGDGKFFKKPIDLVFDRSDKPCG